MNYRRNSFRSSSFIKELATWKMYDDVVFFNGVDFNRRRVLFEQTSFFMQNIMM